MRLTSLRARLLAGVILLAAIGLVALAAVTYAQQREFLEERVDDQARAAGPAVSRALDAQGVENPDHDDRAGRFGGLGRPGGIGDPDRDGPPRGGRGGGPGPGFSLPPGVYGERRAADGEVLGAVALSYGEGTLSRPDLPATLEPGRLITVPSRDGSLDYRVSTTSIPGGSALTVAAVPLSGVDEQLDRLLLVEGAVILVVLLLIGGLGFWVVRVGLRPLDAIGATAGRIADGDLSQRVTPDDPRTEVGRLGGSLNAMLHQIERAFAERTASEDRLRRFLADASHELRTPLSSIRGYAELYRMGAARDPAGAEKAMSRIEQEAARMGVLVEDLLVLARLDEVRDAVHGPVDLAELARDAADDARAADRGRAITFVPAAEETSVLGDGDQLRQVLANLTRNALVHTPAGTPVEVRVERDGDRVVASVRDHGPGLPVEDGAELFERFWRADPARGRGPAGAGLGLAIVQAIVEAHGGEVAAADAPGGGARFAVALPALAG